SIMDTVHQHSAMFTLQSCDHRSRFDFLSSIRPPPRSTLFPYTTLFRSWPIKPLPFDPKKLKGLSEKLIVSHHDNNYAGAARRIGQIQQMLAGLPNNAPGFQIKGLKMEELIATNSAILHEEYFGNLGGDGKASGTAQQAISADFGGFDKWEQSFRATSNALGGGSGWAILNFNLRDGKLH